jgi:hypothetical protein
VGGCLGGRSEPLPPDTPLDYEIPLAQEERGDTNPF